MSETEDKKRSVIDRSTLPEFFPTHTHPDLFWAQLGRTIATFGLLEEVLKRAIFAFTGTREYAAEEIEAAYDAWLPKLGTLLSGQLGPLADSYRRAVRENRNASIENLDEVVNSIKEAATVRNVLCHGSWSIPDTEGKSLPFYINKDNEIFDTRIGISFLRQVQNHATDLVCDVIDSVTQMGWQFPGGGGLGELIWPHHR